MKKRTYFNSSVDTTESNITNRTFIVMLHEPSDNIKFMIKGILIDDTRN
jgi:hypothetical protein